MAIQKLLKDAKRNGVSVLAAILLVSGCTSGASNKWRIEMSESAKSDGNIVFRIAPEGEDPIDVDIRVFDHTSENQVAHRIRNELLEQLPPQRFTVEVDDGEDVLLKKRKGENFRLNLVSNTVKSVRINLDRE